MKDRISDFSLYIPGMIFIILGFLMVFYPMLLVALFSAGLVVLGMTAISLAHRLRKWRQGAAWTVIREEHSDHFLADRMQRVFLYRRW